MIDEVGNRYGKLVVISLHSLSSRRGSSAKWLCQCDCGETTISYGNSLRSGGTKSCGCFRKSGLFRLPPGVSAVNRAIIRIKGNAKKTGVVYTLSFEQARNLLSSPCHYCGCVGQRIITTPTGSFVCNGVDQKNAGQGYTPKNSLPCCSKCNQLKRNYSI